jgi:hypothetical protein
MKKNFRSIGGLLPNGDPTAMAIVAPAKIRHPLSGSPLLQREQDLLVRKLRLLRGLLSSPKENAVGTLL